LSDGADVLYVKSLSCAQFMMRLSEGRNEEETTSQKERNRRAK
jgi:hypothetical protein